MLVNVLITRFNLYEVHIRGSITVQTMPGKDNKMLHIDMALFN